ncbi:uncharacterized protein G2W53_022486 [Senna tora]|uniref:Uncharacterized protein n=1 Tax=Senna tora TaxID=362788 RepID=A0A834TMS1_9FABA|nr:uncharacterized protein G2W53_022486 [Senna tora]
MGYLRRTKSRVSDNGSVFAASATAWMAATVANRDGGQ